MEIEVEFKSEKLKTFSGKYILTFSMGRDWNQKRQVTTCIMSKDGNQFWSGIAIKHPNDEHSTDKGYKVAFAKMMDDMVYQTLQKALVRNPDFDLFGYLSLKSIDKMFRETFWQEFLKTLSED